MAYQYFEPQSEEIPILFSSPHSGREIPAAVLLQMREGPGPNIPDTDFDVDKLYDFVPKMGAHLLCAKYNRYVIDLNRAKDSKPLYTDGRTITNLVPETSFLGDKIYHEKLSKAEIETRIKSYYDPYHFKIGEVLADIKQRHSKVLLFECHSILRNVKSIREEDFPDLMIGTVDGVSLPKNMEKDLFSHFKHAGYTVQLNDPFKGGYITRNYHDTSNGIYTVQLEMSKDLYLNIDSNTIDRKKSKNIVEALEGATEIFRKGLNN